MQYHCRQSHYASTYWLTDVSAYLPLEQNQRLLACRYRPLEANGLMLLCSRAGFNGRLAIAYAIVYWTGSQIRNWIIYV